MSQLCLIVCNGEMPSHALFSEFYQQATYSIAADGGLKVFQKYNCNPNLLVGDLDSAQIPSVTDYEVVHVMDQENNDFEKALDVGVSKGFYAFVVLGATGRRIDQTLKNLSVALQFFNKGFDIKLIDDYFESFILPKSVELESWKGQVISLFPISGEVLGISTEGLKYALHKESLENGVRDGSSNEATESKISITYELGNLLIMRQYKAHELD